MEVYVLHYDIDYEGAHFIGVYMTLKGAYDRMVEEIDKMYPPRDQHWCPADRGLNPIPSFEEFEAMANENLNKMRPSWDRDIAWFKEKSGGDMFSVKLVELGD